MEIKFKNKELDKKAVYQHTRAHAISLKDVEDGTVITPAEIVVYEDTNSKGEINTITSIVTDDGEHYATNSRFFREELLYIDNLMDGEEYSIRILKPTSKGGRTFVTCEMC